MAFFFEEFSLYYVRSAVADSPPPAFLLNFLFFFASPRDLFKPRSLSSPFGAPSSFIPQVQFFD